MSQRKSIDARLEPSSIRTKWTKSFAYFLVEKSPSYQTLGLDALIPREKSNQEPLGKRFYFALRRPYDWRENRDSITGTSWISKTKKSKNSGQWSNLKNKICLGKNAAALTKNINHCNCARKCNFQTFEQLCYRYVNFQNSSNILALKI